MLGAACAAALWQGRTVSRALAHGRRLVSAAARPFEHRPPAPRARVLLVGDSIGVGVGAGHAEASLAALIARSYPQTEVVNRCRSGARVADALAQLRAETGPPFDLALVLAGGNDVLRATPAKQLAQQASQLLAEAARTARRTVWLGSANVGGSPVLAGPLAWWFTWRTGRTMRLIAREARRHGALFVDFFRPPREDPFARRAGIYFAGDGLHPSAVSHRHCFDALRRQAPLDALLDPPPTRGASPWPPSPTS